MENTIIKNEINRREASWYKCGTDIKQAISISEALQMSNLNYEVVKAPVYLSTGYKIPDTFCTKKKSTNDTFGIVGKDYTIVQNDEAFQFIDSIIPEGLTFEKAGETSWMNWILASLPEQYILGDKFVPYVIFQNSHAGGTTLRASISPLRLACNNQFTVAWREAESKVSLRHTQSITGRMGEAQQVLSMAAENMNVMKKQAEKLAMVKVSDEQVFTLVDNLFQVKEDDTTRAINTAAQNRERFLACYKEEDLANFMGTQWGLVNAYSDFVTHRTPGRTGEKTLENKFISISMNTGIMKDFLNMMSKVTA